MECRLDIEQERVRIMVGGRVDESGAEELKKHLQKVNPGTVTDAVLDFGQVTYFGSAGVGKLLLFYKALASHEGRISIINMPRDIYQHFKRVQLDEIFSLRTTS